MGATQNPSHHGEENQPQHQGPLEDEQPPEELSRSLAPLVFLVDDLCQLVNLVHGQTDQLAATLASPGGEKMMFIFCMIELASCSLYFRVRLLMTKHSPIATTAGMKVQQNSR